MFAFREKHTLQGVGHCRGFWSWNVVWLGFARSRVNSYSKEWEDHPNHWGTTYSSIFLQSLGAVLPPLGMSFGLQIGD